MNIEHILHWPPQPTTVLGFIALGLIFMTAPEAVWPVLAAGAAAMVIGDDGSGE